VPDGRSSADAGFCKSLLPSVMVMKNEVTALSDEHGAQTKHLVILVAMTETTFIAFLYLFWSVRSRWPRNSLAGTTCQSRQHG
jgi:hypothetical protein